MKRDHRFFEQWARRNGMSPVVRVTDVEVDGEIVGDILVADSELMISSTEFPNEEHDLNMFFRTGFAIDRPGDSTWIAAFCDYPPDAFSEYAGEARKDARVRECVSEATKLMSQTHKVGLYDGNSRSIN